MTPLMIALFAVAAAVQAGGVTDDPGPPPPQVSLAQPFSTRSPWRLVVTQGAPTEDYGANPAPGALHLCLSSSPNGACDAAEVTARRPKGDPSADWDPHYLLVAKPVYPNGPSKPPLLELVTASLHAGDGGQIRVTQLIRYDRRRDRFKRVYSSLTGTNNNQEVRFIQSGRLQGAMVSADPTSDAPYGYWIEVSRPTPTNGYLQVLRYRSATLYGDGNDLAVIDSEMPEMQRRLGLRAAGSPLPLPTSKPCPRPRLKAKALWCE